MKTLKRVAPRFAVPKPRRRTGPLISPKAMKVIRRVHLYLGLLLLPWVLLYGATALLFNHSTWMSSRTITMHGPDVLRGTSLAPLDPADYASDVAAVTGLATGRDDGTPTELRPENLRQSGGYDFRISDEETSHRVWISTEGAVRVSSSPRRTRAIAPFEIPRETRVESYDRRVETAEAGFAVVRERLGLPEGDVDVRRIPGLRFELTGDGAGEEGPWRADYDSRRGRLSVSSEGRGTFQEEARSFLLDLHQAHGYGTQGGARWIWAAVVDVMGGAMLLWGLTGILMWWQILRTRGAGLVCVVVSTVGAVALGYAMMIEFGG